MQSQITSDTIHIDSEIAPLKKVLIHTPGPEIECMSPHEVEKYLFHGVIFLKDILKDYQVFKQVLSTFAQVFELKKCLADVFEDRKVRKYCLDKILKYYGKTSLKKELMSCQTQELIRILIEGYEKPKFNGKTSLHSMTSDDRYTLPPLPNLYFTRDTAVVVGNKYISPQMAHAVRYTESILTQTIFQFHKDFKSDGLLLDVNHHANKALLKIEGGDVHIWEDDLYLIGLSVRTNAAAIDTVIDALIKERTSKTGVKPFHVLAVCLPEIQTMIHLDMVFTRVGENHALAYGPAITGENPFKVVKISVNHKGKKSFTHMDNLLDALKSINYEIEPIFAGGKSSKVHQQRAQLGSGTNSFALEPNKVICYENEYTFKEFEKAGFTIMDGKNFLTEKLSPSDLPSKLVISIDGSQLSQGGGGPRCMTCPILRT